MSRSPLPFILSIPHAGLAVPPEVAGRVALDAIDIYNECDLWADQLYDFAHSDVVEKRGSESDRCVLKSITTQIARAVVDVNRPPDALDDPDGPIKTQTSYGVPVYAKMPSLEERIALRGRYWGDYHRSLEAAIGKFGVRARLLLDCHNMAQTGPSHYAYAGLSRPYVCLANLGGPDGEPVDGAPVTCPGWLLRRAGEVAADLFADMTLIEPAGDLPPCVALNHPFAGGYIIRRYTQANPDSADGAAKAPLAIMIEVNRGLFVGNQSPRSPVLPPQSERIVAIRNRLSRWAASLADIIEEAGL